MLDLGCGNGDGSEILVDAGADWVLGVDIERTPGLKNPAHGSRYLDFVRAASTHLPLRDASVDVVAAFEITRSVEDLPGTLSEIRRVLSSPGTLVLSTSRWPRRVGVDHRPAAFPHDRRFSRKRLLETLGPYFTDVELKAQRVHPAYGSLPLWDEGDARKASKNLASLVRKGQAVFPLAFRDRLSRLLHNRAFYPGEYDFVFTSEHLEGAHVLIAVCHT